MMPDRQHVQVADNPLAHQHLEYVTFRVAGQKCDEPSLPDPQDHAGLVGGCVGNRFARPQDVKRDPPDCKRLTSAHL